MANVRSANSWYVDTASSSLEAKNVAVMGILLTASGGVAELVLADNVSGASYPAKLTLLQTASTSQYYEFINAPLMFPNGIRVVTATNTKATIVIRIPGESS
jgi:hypothetical protein